VGVRADIYKSAKWSVVTQAELRVNFDGKVKARLSQVDSRYSDVDLPLGAGSGFRMSVEGMRDMGQDWALHILPYYDQTTISQGKFVQLTYDGKPAESNGYMLGAREPGSKTQVYGLNLGISRTF
jgi:ActR/RegA family two-component response regulator